MSTIPNQVAAQAQNLPQNPYAHPFVRYVKRGESLFVEESAVYNTATGTRRLCWPIDGKEMVATGGWSYEPVAPKVSLPESAPEALPAEAPESTLPAADSATAPEFKRGPGRPRKAA